MLLLFYDRYDTLAEFDPSTGRLEEFSRRAEPARATAPLQGTYARVDGRLVSLYRQDDGTLVLRVDALVVPLDTRSRIELLGSGRGRRVRVTRDGRPVAEWHHEQPVLDPPLEEDPTPFVEEEHFDFALYLSNVASDSERCERLYRG